MLPFLLHQDKPPQSNGKIIGKGYYRKAGTPHTEILTLRDAENNAERLNEVFTITKYITTGRPFVVIKIASSFDGKAALADGTSQWTTGKHAR